LFLFKGGTGIAKHCQSKGQERLRRSTWIALRAIDGTYGSLQKKGFYTVTITIILFMWFYTFADLKRPLYWAFLLVHKANPIGWAAPKATLPINRR
jgi:hypothetical protein